ncbi:MAG: beta-galactosidase family protein [Microbacterium sp.]
MTVFEIGEENFLVDGKPFRILSGAIHYFRVHEDLWTDRIRKAREMGLNTIETYVAWNAHEPRPGEWDETGRNDLGRFLDCVDAEGMYAIVRPGPYICAEWTNGGLPVWLTGDDSIRLRSSEPGYLAAVTGFLRRVYDIVAPRQVSHGGPVILVQIENEYGAYGADKVYLEELVRLTREAGVVVPLVTVDQPFPQMLRDGSLPGVHLTGSFGSRAAERLATLREHQPTGPLMAMEFWDGWFDWWGGHHHTTDPQVAAAELETLLAAGASVNFYMFHGGTNFGLTNGANHRGRYAPITTSYDYDAPLDEAGNPTAKYYAFRDVIGRHALVPDTARVAAAAAPEFEVDLVSAGDWIADASDGDRLPAPPTFEQLDFDGALVLYRAELPVDAASEGVGHVLKAEVRDFAWVGVDGVRVGRIDRAKRQRALAIPPGRAVEVLVEDQGRVNYAERIGESKGLIGEVTIDGAVLGNWSALPIDLEEVAATVSAQPGTDAESPSGPVAGPVALRGSFPLAAPSDLFLSTSGWGKGYAFVNGFFLGRYWDNGPQETLYVPAPVTIAGANEVVILELEYVDAARARFVAHARLGHLDE